MVDITTSSSPPASCGHLSCCKKLWIFPWNIMKWLSWILYINSLNWSIYMTSDVLAMFIYIYIIIYNMNQIWPRCREIHRPTISSAATTQEHGMARYGRDSNLGMSIWISSWHTKDIQQDLQLRSHWECVLWQWQAESHPSSHCQLPPSWHAPDVTDQPDLNPSPTVPIFFLVQPRCMVRNPLLGASGFPVAHSALIAFWTSSCSCGDFFQDIPPNPESHSEPN